MSHNLTLSDSLYKQIHSFVDERMGLFFHPSRKNDLIKGLSLAADRFGYKDLTTYIEQLLTVDWTPQQIQTLASYLTVGETYFYRHRDQLNFIIKKILSQQGNNKIKIWSAGCCSGEEPYSCAMLLMESLAYKKDIDIEIIGTDINPIFLKKASEGLYTTHSFRFFPEYLINKYFKQEAKNSFRLSDAIKSKVSFKYLNLAAKTFPSTTNNTNSVNIILCRNVFIYFRKETISEIVKQFSKCLKDNGVLIVAPAETLMINNSILSKKRTQKLTYFEKSELQALEKDIKKVSVAVPRKTFLHEKKIYKTSAAKKTINSDTISKAESSAKPSPYSSKSKYDIDIDFLRKLYLENRYSEILIYSDKHNPVFRKDNEKKEYLKIMTFACANTGSFKNAVQYCNKLLEIDKVNPDSYYIYASILMEAGDNTAAVDNLKKMLYLDRKSVMAHFMLGNIYMQMLDSTKSIKHFKNAFKILSSISPNELVPNSENLTSARLKEIIIRLSKPLGIDLSAES